MKKVIVKASTSAREDMNKVYDALCSLSDAVENLSEHDQDVFEVVTGLRVQTIMDAKYDLYMSLNPQEA